MNMCLNHALFLQKNSYFKAQIEGPSPRKGYSFYLFFLGEISLAFRYDKHSKIILLEDYNNYDIHARATFLFEAAPALKVKFSDDDHICVCTKHNNGHL